MVYRRELMRRHLVGDKIQCITNLVSEHTFFIMVSKMTFMNLAEDAVSGQSTQEFIEVIANNHQALVTFMESDKSFSESFKMSCVRLSNHSSYLYHFLGALKLVGEDRPTSFATVINLLHTVTSPKRHHKMMTSFLIKVTLFFGCLI